MKVPLVTDELRLIVPRGNGKGLTTSDTEATRRRRRDEERRDQGRRIGRCEALDTGTFRWKELAGVPIVAFEAGTAVREMIDRAAAAAGVSLSVVMELRSIESIKQMVAAGIGVGFVSSSRWRRARGWCAKRGKLSRGLAIVRRRDRAASAAVAEFERVLVATAGGRGAGRG